MASRETGARRGLSSGDPSAPPSGRQDAPSPASASATRPTAPTREWEMTVQEQDMMACFRQDYLDLLDGRVATIQRLLGEHEVEPAHVALLSLESSSAMVGARELATAVRRVRTALDGATPGELEPLTAQLVAEAAEVARQLGGPGSTG
ncbi:hypothetical protein GCM10009616_20150 [Microlunatus lacustris]